MTNALRVQSVPFVATRHEMDARTMVVDAEIGNDGGPWRLAEAFR